MHVLLAVGLRVYGLCLCIENVVLGDLILICVCALLPYVYPCQHVSGFLSRRKTVVK